MRAIIAVDGASGIAGMRVIDKPEPKVAIYEAIVEIYASGFAYSEAEGAPRWINLGEQHQGPSIPGHQLAGVVTALGYGAVGLKIGQRVFGLVDWNRPGTLCQYVAIEASKLAPLPDDVDFTIGACLPIAGLMAWQGLFEHGRLLPGQCVLAHAAASAVGSMAVQLAREAGAYVIGTGRTADRQRALAFGAHEFVALDSDALEDIGSVDLVFDAIGGDVCRRSARLVRAGGTLVSALGLPEAQLEGARAIGFVAESNRVQLIEIVERVRDGRLRTSIENIVTFDDAIAAFSAAKQPTGSTIVRIRS